MNGHARVIEYVDFKNANVPYNRMVSFQEGGILAGEPNGAASYIDKKGRHSMGRFNSGMITRKAEIIQTKD